MISSKDNQDKAQGNKSCPLHGGWNCKISKPSFFALVLYIVWCQNRFSNLGSTNLFEIENSFSCNFDMLWKNQI